jgi:hypothetical protein
MVMKKVNPGKRYHPKAQLVEDTSAICNIWDIFLHEGISRRFANLSMWMVITANYSNIFLKKGRCLINLTLCWFSIRFIVFGLPLVLASIMWSTACCA